MAEYQTSPHSTLLKLPAGNYEITKLLRKMFRLAWAGGVAAGHFTNILRLLAF